jgi:hypothetical protein
VGFATLPHRRDYHAHNWRNGATLFKIANHGRDPRDELGDMGRVFPRHPTARNPNMVANDELPREHKHHRARRNLLCRGDNPHKFRASFNRMAQNKRI